MAMNYQNFASLGVNLNRQKYGPLDISNVFTSAADLKYYLTKGTFTEGVSEYWYKSADEKIVPYPYEGQVLATVIDGVVSVYALSLDAEGNFQTQEIGAKVEVDGTTIVKDASGKLSIVAPINPDEKKTYNFSYANGVYSWVEVDTATAAGQAQAIQGLTDRTVALEETVNGKGEGEAHVAGLVEKVAALEAVDNATQAELDAYKEVVTAAIAAGVAEAKKYADDNDADTIYNDSDLQTRVKALEDEKRYDDTEVRELIADLDEAIGDTTGGLVKDIADNKQAIADEKARATAAEKVNSDAIAALIGTDTGKTIRVIAAEETAAIVAGADTKYDTLKEIADFIMNDETGAAAMANDIATLKTAVGDADSGLVKSVADNAAAIAAIVQPKSSAEVTVATDGTLGLGQVSTDKLVQGENALILDGGSAVE